MTDERRYREEEVQQILDLSVEEPRELRAPTRRGEGLSLGELQEIGRQAGIDPYSIAEAARVVRLRERLPLWSTFLGTPPEVGRAVMLPREVTELEWDLMVAEFREAFGSMGEVGTQGGARQWTGGGLRIVLEPTGSGHRLRMSSKNQRLLKLGRIGIVEVVIGVVLLAIILPEIRASQGVTVLDLIRGLLPHVIVIGSGIGFTAWSRSDLSRWLTEREFAMESVAEKVGVLIGRPPLGGDRELGRGGQAPPQNDT
jgi:hypothetical protein